MDSCDRRSLLAVRSANRALEDFAAGFAPGSASDRHLEMLQRLELMLRAVDEDLEIWARTRDTELRDELEAYGQGLIRLRQQLASLQASVPLTRVRVFVKD